MFEESGFVEAPGSTVTPTTVPVVEFYGTQYRVNLDRFRQRMVELDAGRPFGAGSAASFASWPKRMKVSHMTLYRFLKGQNIRLDSLRLMLAALDLSFAEVCTAVTEVA